MHDRQGVDAVPRVYAAQILGAEGVMARLTSRLDALAASATAALREQVCAQVSPSLALGSPDAS